jgi:uncharacterized protein (TIGR03435 family)
MTFADLSPLANHIWQSTLFALAVWLLTLTVRKNRAAVRYWLWLAASAKFPIPFSLLVAAGSQLGWRTAPAIAQPHFSSVMEEISQPFIMPPPAARLVGERSAPDALPAMLLGLWLCGFAIASISAFRSWRHIRAIRRTATPLSLNLPIQAMSSPSRLEPGVFGIRKPVLLLPEGITERLTPPQLEAVLAHELCHIRRRDNLTATIHVLVEAVFWFHPLIWWIRERLVEERERACDEEVLRQAGDPLVYAEGILNVCRFYLESPLVCVSGITGADLKRRIESIMVHRAARQLEFSKRLLLAALGTAAVAVPIVIGLMHVPRGRAQSQPSTATPLSFDVASVKAVSQPWLETAPKRAGGRITWSTDLWYMIGYAYRLQPFRISGPIPGSDSIYRVDATTAPATTDDQVRLMFQSLLADRFMMVAHRVTKDADGYALSIGKGGLKIKEAKAEDKPAPWPEWFRNGPPPADMEGRVLTNMPEPGIGTITGRRVSFSQFSEVLQRVLQAFVLDETGLKGNYYFALRYAQENHPADTDAPSLFAAIQEDLGLKLEKHKGPIETLVVDRVEKAPTEN